METTIVNQYKGKTAEQVWSEWTIEQREQFISDHYQTWDGSWSEDKQKLPKLSYGKLISVKYPKELRNDFNSEKGKIIYYALEKHISEGQYGKGGRFSDFLKKAHEVAKKGYEKAKPHVQKAAEEAHKAGKKVYETTKEKVKEKIHDKKKDIAWEVLQDTRVLTPDDAQGRRSSQYLNEAANLVEEYYKEGGRIPKDFNHDAYLWFEDLIEYVRSGRADDPRLPELMQIANGEPTEANLLRFKAELTECTCHEPKIKENIIKNINSILEESDEEEIDFFFTVFADAVNKGQDKTENYSETEFLKYAHDVIFDLLKNDRSVGMKESSDWNIYTNNGLYYIQPMVHLQKGNTDIVKSAAFTMFNDMDVAVAEFIFDENGEFTAISKRFGWNKKIFCGGGNVYAKGGGISSPKEYFESIDTSLLPQSASEYLASPYILYHPELQNLSMDDEDFKNVMEIIESNYSKVEEEQEEAMTVESYREMIEGLELMLTLTKGKEKQEIKDELEGIKLLAEIEFPTEKFCGGGSVPAMKSGGHEFGAAAEKELGYNPSEDEEWSETMREDVTGKMVTQYGKVKKSRGINV